MRLLTLAAGAAVGYVLGARAGREKYEQIVASTGRLRANPTAGQAVQAVQELFSAPAGRLPGAGPAPAVKPATPSPASTASSSAAAAAKPASPSPAATGSSSGAAAAKPASPASSSGAAAAKAPASSSGSTVTPASMASSSAGPAGKAPVPSPASMASSAPAPAASTAAGSAPHDQEGGDTAPAPKPRKRTTPKAQTESSL